MMEKMMQLMLGRIGKGEKGDMMPKMMSMMDGGQRKES